MASDLDGHGDANRLLYRVVGDESGALISGAHLSVHDTLLPPPGECCRDLVLTSGSTDEISLLVKTKRQPRRKPTSEATEAERANGTARRPGNGRAHRRVPEESIIQESDQSRPANVQVAKKGRLETKAVTHRTTRPAPQSKPPFAPQDTAAVATTTTSRNEKGGENLMCSRAQNDHGLCRAPRVMTVITIRVTNRGSVTFF